MDAAALNLKSFSEKTYSDLNGGHLEPVLETLKTVHKAGVWLEIINLVVPTYTDNVAEIRKMCGWIAANLGTDCPMIFSRFFPKYQLVHLSPTPVEVLQSAREAARAEGLKYVYIGNVAGESNEVQCGSCGKTVVERNGYFLSSNRIVAGKCPFCGKPVPGRWQEAT
jgi:pyruvate formate lyase activating enzyme